MTVRKTVATLCAAVFMLTTAASPAYAQDPEQEPSVHKAGERTNMVSSGNSYDSYLAEHNDWTVIQQSIRMEANTHIPAGASYTVPFSAVGGLAALRITYRMGEGNSRNGECRIELNGKLPFSEASGIRLNRQWQGDTPGEDERGNQYSVQLTEDTGWQTTVARAASGYYLDPLLFALEEGENALTITAEKGDIELSALEWIPGEESYPEAPSGAPSSTEAKPVRVQAEFPTLRSDSAILELCDRTTPDMTPSFTGLQRWNAIGGSGWSQVGQSVTWEVQVKESGYYSLALRYKQNFSSGKSSVRRLLIDGKVPCEGLEYLTFPYKNGWNTLEPRDAEGVPYQVYLEAGPHMLTLEVSYGDISGALHTAEESLYALNTIYRKIISLTGSTPDEYRDYQIEKYLPDVIDDMKQQLAVLTALSDELYGGKSSGEDAAALNKITWQLGQFIKYPETIPANLRLYLSNVTAVSQWIQDRQTQPLSLDYLELVPAGTKHQAPHTSFFQTIWFHIRQFFQSFCEDYGMVGNLNQGEETIEVWILQGRDQYQILKEQIDSDFTAKNGIPVDLKLITGGLIEAIAADIAPDVFLFANGVEPVNLALRGAVMDLSAFPDYDEVAGRFSKEAIVPFQHDGGVYALPITHNFLMMFTRDDLLQELGLEVPQTWDDVYNMLTILQLNNMDFAYPIPSNQDVSSYALLLFQEQSDFYHDGGKSTALDTGAAMNAFENWISLYKEYDLSKEYNFVNRFRSGDMPVGIVDYSTYNTLEVSAPEIRGLWSMHPVPGTKQEDGTVQHNSVSTVTSAIILSDTKQPDKSWEFLKWWTDEPEQLAFATAIENRMGTSARFATANLKAFEQLPWTASTLSSLQAQRETALSVKQVPGGYFLSRHIDNIFRAVIDRNANLRDTVLEYTEIIDAEITRKRLEFRLDVNGE